MVAIGPANSWIPENNNEPENNSKKKYKGVWIPIVILIIAIIGVTGWFTYDHTRAEKKTDKVYLFLRGGDVRGLYTGDDYFCLDEFSIDDAGNVTGKVYIPDNCSIDYGEENSICLRIQKNERTKGVVHPSDGNDFVDLKIKYPKDLSSDGTITFSSYNYPYSIYKSDTKFVGYYGWLKTDKTYS